MKTCSRCNQQKEEREFQIRRASNDGLSAACKACLSDYDRSRANLPQRVKARAEYQKSDRGKARGNAAKVRFSLRNPWKRKAHIIVGNFLRDGKLIRPVTCETCGVKCKPQAHHCDYSKTTEVMWLCTSCHSNWHKFNTPIYPFESSPGQEKPMNKFTHEYRKYLLRPIPDRKLSPSERADRKELYLIIQQERANDDSPPSPSNYTPADPYLNDNRKGLGGASRSD